LSDHSSHLHCGLFLCGSTLCDLDCFWTALLPCRPTFEQVLRELQALRAADPQPTPALHVVLRPPRKLPGSTPSNKGSDSASPPVSSHNQVREGHALLCVFVHFNPCLLYATGSECILRH
jgi:hypothetical protein